MRRAASLVLLALTAARAPARDDAPLEARAQLDRSQVQLGEPVAYRAWVTVPHGLRARWLRPDSSEALELSDLAARRGAGPEKDTLWAGARLRVWLPGTHTLAGPPVQVGEGAAVRVHRLPAVEVTGLSTLRGAQDQELRPWRAPLPAPWWERVPWRWVAAAVLALAGLAVLARARRRAAAPAPIAAPAPDPGEAALAALAVLRARRLPEAGRFAEHAFELGQIMRRYLEATVRTPRPGDTTPELVEHLGEARFAGEEIPRLHALLSEWDQVKFARRPSGLDQARRAEQAVEGLVRRVAMRREAA